MTTQKNVVEKKQGENNPLDKEIFCKCKKPDIGVISDENERTFICLLCTKEINISKKREMISVGAFQRLSPHLSSFVGTTLDVVDEKKKTIVGSLLVVPSPKELTYIKKYISAPMINHDKKGGEQK